VPKAPTYTPQVQQAGIPSVRRSPSAPIEAFGGGTGDALNQGLQPVLKTAGAIFEEEKKKADDVATQAAYSELVKRKNRLGFDPERGAFAKRGKDAFGVIDEYNPLFDKEADDIEANMLRSSEQRAMFRRMRESEKREFSGQLQRHLFTETQRHEEETTATTVSTLLDDSVLNWAEPGRLEGNLGKMTAVIRAHAGRNGKGDEYTARAMAEATSKTHAAIIDRMIYQDLDAAAGAHFKKYEAQITTAAERAHVEKRLADAQTTRRGMEAWEKVSGLRFGNGEFNQAAQEKAVMAMDLPPKQKMEVWSYVKARATEATSQMHQADLARDEGFLDAAYKARSEGKPIADTMKLVDRFVKQTPAGPSDRDRNLKLDAIRKIYAPKTASDTRVFLDHWERVRNGNATLEEIDADFAADRINDSDYRALRKDWYEHRISGKDPEMKNAEDYVKLVANRVADKEQRDKFEHTMRVKSRGKSPDEIRAMADEEAKNPWIGSPRFETSFENIQETSLARGQLAQTIGATEAGAIVDGIQKKGGGRMTAKQGIDAFVQFFGGYDAVKPGTPVHNAIQSLLKRKDPKERVVTPATVKAVLDAYPDGKW
jgi:hypothetical protein